MAENYILRHKVRFEQQDYDLDMVAVTSSSVFYELTAWRNRLADLVIYNEPDSGKIIRIKTLDIEDEAPVHTAGIAANTSKVQFCKLHGTVKLSDGVTVPAVKLDSNHDDCLCNVFSSFEYSAKSVIKLMGEPTNRMHTTSYMTNFSTVGPNVFGNSRMIDAFQAGETTPIVINEGDVYGICHDGSNHGNRPYEFTIRITEAGNSYNHYIFNWVGYVDFRRNAIAIENPSGSGKIYNIISVEMNQVIFVNRRYTSMAYPHYWVCPIESIRPDSNNVVNLIPLDSTNSLHNSGISIYRNVMSYKRGETSGVVGTPTAFAKIQYPQTPYPTKSIPLFEYRPITETPHPGKIRPFDLYPGEGIGIFTAWLSSVGIPYIWAELSIETYTAPGGGGERGFAYA